MNFPGDDRAELAKRLLDSLDQERRQAIDMAWAGEAERRLTALDHGEVETIDGERVMRNLASGKKPRHFGFCRRPLMTFGKPMTSMKADAKGWVRSSPSK